MNVLRGLRWRKMWAVSPVVPVLVWASLRMADPPALRLVVDISERQMTVLERGKVVRRYAVAVGRPSNPTPRGTFRTGTIDWNPSWTPPDAAWARNRKPQPPGSPKNPMQAVKIYFKAPDYYIHGTNDPGSIGEAASRGCVRMRPTDARNLARRIQRAGGGVPLVIKA